MKKEIYELVLPEYTTPIPQEHIDVFCELRDNRENRRRFYLLDKMSKNIWNVRNVEGDCHYANVPRKWFKKYELSAVDEYIMTHWDCDCDCDCDCDEIHVTKDEIRSVWHYAIGHYIKENLE
jgi:hypothetical protein